MQNNIIEKWKEKELQELCDIEIGKTPSRSDKNLWDKDFSTTNTWLSIADLNNTENKQVYTSKEQISDLATQNSKLVKTGTLLLSFKLTIGRVAFAGKDLYTNEAIAQLPTKNAEEIDKNYLYYYLQYYNYDELLKGDVKVKGKTLNKEKLKHIRVIYPDIDNQQRIVKVLDEAFENIEKAKQNTLQNLNNAKELFESKLTNLFESSQQDWEMLKISEISSLKQSKQEAKKLNDNDLVSFVPMEFLGINQKYFNSNITKPLKEVINKYVYFAEGDVVMAKITPCFENGKISIAKNLHNKIGFGSSEYIVFRPNNRVINEFLYYFLNRSSYRKLGEQNMKGAVGHKRVSKEFIENTIIKFPTNVTEQQKIVHQLDELQEQVKNLEQIYEQKIKDLDELKQSLLQKAFNGEL